MKIENSGQQLRVLLEENISREEMDWLDQQCERIASEDAARNLYMTYSLMSSKIPENPANIENPGNPLAVYLASHQISVRQLARLYLLTFALEKNPDYYKPKIARLIQVADTGELETFLRYLPVLPHGEAFRESAVEALRTNIATVFDAIALDNPYPSEHFNDQQWNQMYLKAAFMQRDLSRIIDVDKRANPDLARIISDYAHERWAASRHVDPRFWRPVPHFIEGQLLDDMRRLLESDNEMENMAGALCCHTSDKEKAQALLKDYPELHRAAQENKFSWQQVKN